MSKPECYIQYDVGELSKRGDKDLSALSSRKYCVQPSCLTFRTIIHGAFASQLSPLDPLLKLSHASTHQHTLVIPRTLAIPGRGRRIEEENKAMELDLTR